MAINPTSSLNLIGRTEFIAAAAMTGNEHEYEL